MQLLGGGVDLAKSMWPSRLRVVSPISLCFGLLYFPVHHCIQLLVMTLATPVLLSSTVIFKVFTYILPI